VTDHGSTLPVCVVVNGPSAVGKSTLVQKIQARSAIPLLRFGVDELYRMVPCEWAGGTRDPIHSKEGFSYQFLEDGEGNQLRVIINGPDAVRMLLGMNAATCGFLASGNHVIVDGQGYEPRVNEDLRLSLKRMRTDGRAEVSVIELTVSPGEIVTRQELHAHPAGIALAQLRSGPVDPDPDLLFDTTGLTPDRVFEEVWAWLASRHPALT
jgi:chloramphenicol 3-O-phosphotransferase